MAKEEVWNINVTYFPDGDYELYLAIFSIPVIVLSSASLLLRVFSHRHVFCWA